MKEDLLIRERVRYGAVFLRVYIYLKNMVFLTPLDFKINNTRARVHFLRSYLLSPPEYLKFIKTLNDIYKIRSNFLRTYFTFL